MWTDNTKKRNKLSLEILMIFAVCFVISLIFYFLIASFGVRIVEEYCFYNEIVLDEEELYHLDSVMISTGLVIAVCLFVALFLILFSERLAYIRRITAGVHALRQGELASRVDLEGNNELTQLAEALNYLCESEQKMREKEKKLSMEKEELIRTLSHDIRTPLTSIISYTELLGAKDSLTLEEQKAYLALVGKKSAQIKELTDILIDGGKREIEFFEDARLLFAQLAEEFETELEEDFELSLSLFPFPSFSGRFDIGEMRRIFDNLISNIKKYAEPGEGVFLSVSKTDAGVTIRQSNAVKKEKTGSEGYRMGINSIRRIAHNYKGTVEVSETEKNFKISVTLSDI